MFQQESVWNHLNRKIMKITSQAKEKFDDSLQLCSQVHSCATSGEDSGCRSSSGHGMEVEYHPIFAKDQSRLHQFGNKVLPGIFLGYVLYARSIW